MPAQGGGRLAGLVLILLLHVVGVPVIIMIIISITVIIIFSIIITICAVDGVTVERALVLVASEKGLAYWAYKRIQPTTGFQLVMYKKYTQTHVYSNTN